MVDQEKTLEELELKDALNIASVRNVLWRAISKGNIFAKTGPIEEKEANYRNGMRAIALEIIDDIEDASMDAWIIMQQENRGESNE